MAFILSVYASRRENSNWSRETEIINIWVCVTLGILKCHVNDVNCFQMPLKMLFEQRVLVKTHATGRDIRSKVTLKSLKDWKRTCVLSPGGKSTGPQARWYGSGWWQHPKLYKYGGPCRNRPKMNKISTGPVENKHTPLTGNICYSGKNPGQSKRSPGCTTFDMT